MAPVPVSRVFRLPITAVLTALALSGCVRTVTPVAVAPQGDLDSMAYGRPSNPAPQVAVDSSGGGAISAVRNAFAAPRPVNTPVPVAYAAARAPVRYEA